MKQRAGKRPERPDPGAWTPKFVVVVAINPDLRERHPDMPLSLDEALRLGAGRRETEADPLPDLEAEP